MILIAFSTSAEESRLEMGARNLVSEYFAALTQGNTELLFSIIGGDLLESRRKLLQNPDYASYLSDAYKDTKVSITGSRQLTNHRVEVDARIEKSLDEQFTIRLIIEDADGTGAVLLIVAEQDSAS